MAEQENDDKNQIRQDQTGWERLKEAFVFEQWGDGDTTREVKEVVLMFFMGAVGGAIYGGIPASRHARERYMQVSQATPFPSKLEAVGHSYNAATRGFTRYGFRWGWRAGLMASGFHLISTAMATYKDSTDIQNYTTAGAIVGGLYRIPLGLRGVVGGAFAGCLISVPAGLIMVGLQKLSGETFLERNKKSRLGLLYQEQHNEQNEEVVLAESSQDQKKTSPSESR